MKRKTWIKKPIYIQTGALSYLILRLAGSFACRLFHVRFNKDELKAVRELKAPVLVLGTHNSPIDFLYMAKALYPKKLSFVIAANMYFDKRYAWALRRLRNAIPKKQFSADYECVKAIKGMIDNGISVGLYPEGRVSVDGTECWIGMSIAKLIKWLNVPVVTVKNHGGYLAMPRFDLRFRYGRNRVQVEQILDVETIKSMSAEQVLSYLREKLSYNDYEYQERNHIAFKGKNLASGLSQLLYRCPRCGKEYEMSSDGNVIKCEACGNTATLDEYGVLTPVDGSECPRRVDYWYKEQYAALADEIMKDGEYELGCKATVSQNDEDSGGFKIIESGIIKLTKQGYEFEGEAGKKLHFTISSMPSISFEVGKSIDFFRDNVIYRIGFIGKQMATKFNIATELLYKKYFDESAISAPENRR